MNNRKKLNHKAATSLSIAFNVLLEMLAGVITGWMLVALFSRFFILSNGLTIMFISFGLFGSLYTICKRYF